MKNNKKIKTKWLFWIVCLIVVVVVGIIFYLKQSYNSIKTYHSKFLDITVDVPNDYSIEDKNIVIVFKKSDSNHTITLLRSGTNNDSIDGYLLDIAEYNHLKLTNKENLIISQISAIKVDINGRTTYLFYKDNAVYSFETNFPELYDDLDQIAKSFRYEP